MRRSGMDVDVAEYDDELVVVADIPGVAKADLDLTVRDGVLSIATERTIEADETDESRAYIRRERRAESMRRSITLPTAVREARATYSNGVLTVTLPKVHVDDETDEGHRIDVN